MCSDVTVVRERVAKRKAILSLIQKREVSAEAKKEVNTVLSLSLLSFSLLL